MTHFITPELKYFPYKDGSLAYREEGTGPVLFFLHGMNGNSRSWASSFLLLRSDFRVIALDALALVSLIVLETVLKIIKVPQKR
jgi:hypothetical protein